MESLWKVSQAVKAAKKGKAKKEKDGKEDKGDKEGEGDKGELSGRILRIVSESHPYSGVYFLCQTSTKEQAQGFVQKEPGYWKDDKRWGNVFVKITDTEILEEARKGRELEEEVFQRC